MSLPIQPIAGRSGSSGPWSGPGSGPFHDPGNFAEVFLAAFRRDLQSFYPGSGMEREAIATTADHRAKSARIAPTFALDFQLLDDQGPPEAVRVSLFGAWYRLAVPCPLDLGPRDRDLLRAIGRVMELHHQVLLRWSRGSLLRLRRGMPEDHYVAACLEPSAYANAESAPSRIAEAILTLRTMALSTYENRRVSTGALILGHPPGADLELDPSVGVCPDRALPFGLELTGLKSLHRLCDGRRTLFLVDRRHRLAEIIDIRQWAINQMLERCEATSPEEAPAGPASASSDPAGTMPPHSVAPVLNVPCARAYMFHALATSEAGHVCLVLSPNQEIKVFAQGVQAFVFAHGRWRVLDPESKYGRWEEAVGQPSLARVLFQTALDLAEERQGGLLVVVHDPSQAIGRLIAPQDVLEPDRRFDLDGQARAEEAFALESPARPFTLFGLNSRPEPSRPQGQGLSAGAFRAPDVPGEPLTKRSLHYLARGRSVTGIDAAVLEALAGLDGALVTDAAGRLIAMGAILRHDVHSFPGSGPASDDAPMPEGARTTAAMVASHFGPVLKISQDGIVSCFLAGERVWDL